MSRQTNLSDDFQLLSDTLGGSQYNTQTKSATTSASSLLEAYRAAKSSTNPFKTLFPPIDHVIGPFMRPGNGIQISSPPGCYVEQLLLGLIRGATSAGREVAVVDCQNKLKPYFISKFLDRDEYIKKIFYQSCHQVEDLIQVMGSIPNFLSKNVEISLLILSSLSFPLQLESKYSKRQLLIEQVREFIVKICKQNNVLVVITSNMSTQFRNADGSRGTFDHDGRGVMKPQLDLTCKCISSLVIWKTSQTSGSARFIPGTGQDDVVTEFDYDVGHAFDSKPQLITNPGNGFPGKSYRRAKLRSSQLSQIHEWAQPKPKAAHVKLRGSHRHDAVSMTRIYDSLMLCPDAAHAVLIRSTTADNELENDLT